MKKLIGVLMIAATLTACDNDNVPNETEEQSETAVDTTRIEMDQTVTSGNQAATHSQVIPRDSVELTSDSTGNISPGSTGNPK